MPGEGSDNTDHLIVLVSLTDESGYVKGNPYRELGLSADTPLSEVAGIILDSFGFDSGRPFGFFSIIHGDYSSSPWQVDSFSPEIASHPISVIRDLPQSQILFVYDFEEQWRFLVKYIGKMDPPQNNPSPVILSSEGMAPDQYGPAAWDNPEKPDPDLSSGHNRERFYYQKRLFEEWD
ncbi:MAG: hypothetical protein JXA44_09325 [Methanospirillaceae archaeon]|nr:hypothetical protein [Methanospirillaceae archaeon]